MKNPLFIIAGLFLVVYYVVSQLSNNNLSNEALIIGEINPPEIIMFGSLSCHYCGIARGFFKKHQLAYIEHNIDQSLEHREMFYRLGGQGTPLIIINDSIVHGFDEQQIRQALSSTTTD